MTKQIANRNEKLFQSLQALCKKAIDKTVLHRDQGNLETITYQCLPVKSIDYLMETYQPDWNRLEYFDSYNWRSEDFVSFHDQQLCTLPEFEAAAQEVMKEFNAPEYAVKRIGLLSLLHLIMRQAPNGQITYNNVDQYVQLFIDGYESYRSHILTNWRVDLWLGNIYMESDEIEIAPKVFLRRPTKEQLVDIKPKPNYISEFERMTGRRLFAGAILSFSVPASNRPGIGLYPKKITLQIEKWLNIFRLLKPTDVTVVHESVSPSSIFEYPHSQNKEKPQDKFWLGKVEYQDTSSYKLYLKKEEEEVFKKFIRSLKPVFKGLSQKSYLTGNPYELGFHRYNDSLLKTEVNAYRIVASISSFESLLKNGKFETAIQVKPRVTKLLTLVGFKSTKILDKLTSAYTLRNALAHGERPKEGTKNLLKFARKYTHEILNFNRICLLVSLQLKETIDKPKLIELIDNSLKDKRADDNLKKLISDKVNIPIVNPFPKVRRNQKLSN